jgi:hypothetical protein
MSRWSGASSRPTRLAVELAAPRGKGERPIRKTAAPPEFTGALIPEGAPAKTSMPEAPRNRVSRIARTLGIGRLRAGSGPGARSLRWRSAVREAGRTSRIFVRLLPRGNEPQPGAVSQGQRTIAAGGDGIAIDPSRPMDSQRIPTSPFRAPDRSDATTGYPRPRVTRRTSPERASITTRMKPPRRLMPETRHSRPEFTTRFTSTRPVRRAILTASRSETRHLEPRRKSRFGLTRTPPGPISTL